MTDKVANTTDPFSVVWRDHKTDTPHTQTEYTRKDISDAKDKRIEELEAERDETMREALSLARSLHKAHYSDVTQWEPLTYPAGVVSQIDNMVAGIVARAEAAEAKMAKAVDALDGMCRQFSPYPSEDTERWREEHEAWDNARATLAEIKGGKDG